MEQRAIYIFLLLSAMSIAGCSGSEADHLVDVWYQVGGTERLQFFDDGSVQLLADDQMVGEYSFPAQGKLKIEFGGLAALAGPMIFDYEVDGETLRLIDPDGSVDTYSRKEADAKLGTSEVRGGMLKDGTTDAKADIRNIVNALMFYRLDTFAYPTSEQGLEALVTNPNVENWKPGGYLDSLPKDPWGNDYQYRNPGDNGDIDVYSLGADGRPGGSGRDADIGNWEQN